MRILLLCSFAVFFSSLVGTAQAKSPDSSFQARVELMKYAIQFEKKYPVQTSKAGWAMWFNSISLNPEAEAYTNGQACLVLGFKSTFSGNLCKLSSAEGASAYQASCTGGTLPCNPAVFGKADGSTVFCASSGAGNQLSKSCAFQSFQYLDQKSNHAIPGFAGVSEANFDISKLNLSANADVLKTAAQSMFTGDGASLESAYAFTDQLCRDIASGKKTGNQPQDVKTCRMYLGFLGAAKTAPTVASANPSTSSAQPATANTTVRANATVNRSPAVVSEVWPIQNAPVITSPASMPVMSSVAGNAAAVSCSTTAPTHVLSAQANTQIHTMVNSIAQQTQDSTPAQINACLKALEAQPEIPPGKKGVYWKMIDGKKTLSMRCEEASNTEVKYAFVTDDGYQQVSFQKVGYVTHYDNDGVPASETVYLPRQNAAFKSGSTTYYVNMDQGDSFSLAKESELASTSSSRFGISAATLKSRVALYESKLSAQGLPTTTNLLPVDISSPENGWVGNCVQRRTTDFLSILLAPGFYESGDMPNSDRIMADWNLPGNSPVLAQRYGKSISELRESFRAKILARVPACNTVVNTDVFSKAFDRSFGSIQNYETLHNRVGH